MGGGSFPALGMVAPFTRPRPTTEFRVSDGFRVAFCRPLFAAAP